MIFIKNEKTCLSKYHNSTYFGSNDHFEKTEKTCLREYMNPPYFGSKEFLDRMMNIYGTLHPSHTYNYYGVFFDSSWKLAVWIYCIDHNIPIMRNPRRFIYNYDNKDHYYEPDFLINNELVEIKGDQFLDKTTGKWINPYDRSLDNLYETKHQCAINNNVKILYSSECKEYVDYCNTAHPGWNKTFLSNNSENPSYFKFVYCIPNAGVSIYDMNKDDDYTIVKNKGVSPFDIGLKTRE